MTWNNTPNLITLYCNYPCTTPIPVSCFTATAKQKVISDIRDYFKRKLDIDLRLFASTTDRQNLHYAVIHADTEDEKYNFMRNLLIGNPKPTIIYVSRTKKTTELAQKLTRDGYTALPFNGKMDANDKVQNQNAFINNEAQIMVATSAFGMGVDKKDVGMVIHYDISEGGAQTRPHHHHRVIFQTKIHDLKPHQNGCGFFLRKPKIRLCRKPAHPHATFATKIIIPLQPCYQTAIFYIST